MSVSLYDAFVNTAFAGLVLAFLLLLYYYRRVREVMADAGFSPYMNRYYNVLLAATMGGMFSFVAVFVFLWYTRLASPVHDWVRLSLDVLQLVFIILVAVVGRKLVKVMITIQKKHGL